MKLKTLTKPRKEMRSRLRCFASVFLPMAVLSVGVMLLLEQSVRRGRLAIVEAEERSRLEIVQKGVTGDFRTVVLDLQFLAGQRDLQKLIQSGWTDQTAAENLIDDYQGFARKGLYDQIRVLDASGMETIRIDYRKRKPVIVPRERHQSKASRYYFQEAIRLRRGQIYVSPLDLNVENEQIEQPLKPMIRFAVPVFDQQEKARGIVVLNYLAAELLNRLQDHSAKNVHLMLVNSDGYWLKALDPDDEWGFMYRERKNRTFANRFPNAWGKISEIETGQVYDAGGLLGFTTISPMSDDRLLNSLAPAQVNSTLGNNPPVWKLVSILSPVELDARAGYARTPVRVGLVALAVLASFLVARGIHTRRRIVAELRQLQSHQKLVLDGVGDGIHALDLDGRIVFENPASAKMLGWEVNEMIGKPAHASMHHSRADGASYPQNECPIYACLRDRLSRRVVDEVFWRKDGSSFPVEYMTTSIRDEKGAVVGAVVVFSDITERKRAVEALTQAKQSADMANRAKADLLAEMGAMHAKLEAITQAVPDLLYMLSPEGMLLWWNANLETISGIDHGSIARMTPFDFVAEGEGQRVAAALQQAAETGFALVEVQLRTINGLVPYEFNAVPVKDGTGKFLGLAGAGRDIRERKNVAAKLLQAKDAADNANRTKSEFLANMSHEIRTPITAIVGFADMMLDPVQTQSDRFDGLQTIRRNAQHLLGLINDMLDLSKIEAGKMTVERIECDLPLLLCEVMSMLHPRATEKSLQIKLSLDTPVPRMICTDALRLRQVLVNLLGNAIKFTPSGQIRVHVAHSDAEGPLYFSIVDSGIGMTDEQMSRLFQPFTQADGSTTRRFGGTGLGLTISKRLTELLGGDIAVTSEPGKGSTFRVWIDAGAVTGPMVTSIEDTILQPGDGLAGGDIDSMKLHGRILLAEDGIDNQRFISAMLRRTGAEVVVANNGKAAVDLALSKSFDIVFMDMQMPELDGYAATSKLRSRGCKFPIIALTAHAMAEDRAKCLQAGCTDYLTKPIDRVKLVRTAAKYIAITAAANASAVPLDVSGNETEPTMSHFAKLISSYSDDPVMKEILVEFVSNLPSQVAQIKHFVAADQAVELREMMHQFKGAGGSFGFSPITTGAAAIEARLKSGDAIQAIHDDVESLLQLIRSVDGYCSAAETANEQELSHAKTTDDR